MLAKSTAWVENSFPALEDLFFRFSHEPTVLPIGFLVGRSDAPPRRLREIGLCKVSFPYSFIRSSCNLVDLYLVLNPCGGAGSLSAEALATALSETHRFERLSISPYPIKLKYPDQRIITRPSSPTNTRVVLCSLTT